MKDCLDCKYEPDWGKETGLDYPRRTGACKWELTHELPPLPAGYVITRNHITKHMDGSGLPTKCKACCSVLAAKRRASNLEQYKAREAKYYALNPDKMRAKNVKYRTENPDKMRAAVNRWRAANPDYFVKWRAANPNPEAVRIHAHNRRARKREAGGRLSNGLADKLFKLQRGKCACGCGKPLGTDYHLDHRMPLALGGANEDWNMQLLTATCNMQKSSKHPIDFMQQRGFLL